MSKTKKDNLSNAIDVLWRFQQMCLLQLDNGYWATMDFPTKHHVNRILSIEYTDEATLNDMYGPKLVERAREMIPICKKYLAFSGKLKD